MRSSTLRVATLYLMAQSGPQYDAYVKRQRQKNKPVKSKADWVDFVFGGGKKTPSKKPEAAPAPKAQATPHKALFSEEEHKLPAEVKQPKSEPDALFKHAKEAHEQQLDWLNRGKGLDSVIKAKVVRGDNGDFNIDYDKPGPVILIGPMKTQERCKEKVNADFDGDWSQLGDIVRASVAVDSMKDIHATMAALRKSGLKLARKPKDRFTNPTEAGYRDMLMNVTYPNGHVGELQLHLKPVLKAKDAGHKYYEETRSVEAKAKKEGRKTMTPEETEIVNAANAKMRKLYSDAWDKAGMEKQAHAMTANEPLLKQATSTQYYEYNDMPAEWEKGMFPVVYKPGKKQEVVYDLQTFFEQAARISASQFKTLSTQMEAGQTKKSAARVATRFTKS